MTTPILHHYPNSPFAEKMRRILAFKKIAYRSVIIPVILPKPDVVELTGGYRRTPVLQMGADIYCDTRLQARVLEELAPKPTLYPEGYGAACDMLAHWADTHLFQVAVAVAFSPAGAEVFARSMPQEQMAAFMKDRTDMFTKGKTPAARMPLDVAQSHFDVYLRALDVQLGESGEFLLDKAPFICDFSLYHCLWFVRNNPGLAPLFKPFGAVCAWMDKMAALKHDKPQDLSSADAIKEAHAAKPKTSAPSGAKPVHVIETQLGIDPVEGALGKGADDEIIIHRESPRAGPLAIHFPQVGYRVGA